LAKPSKYDGLQHDLCVGWGFCGCVTEGGEPKHVDDFIPEHGLVTAAQFADWAIKADWPWGYDHPEFEKFHAKWADKIASLFVKHMGADTVDASVLQWSTD
jgi:hypothetical protein